tara:strand:+ start:1391 stop:1561 length:171 start_codon:yes stop_codon:yes gene_type:complete
MNKVTHNKSLITDKECNEAIDYLYCGGAIDQMRRDERHYTMVLLKRVADTLNITLI